MTHVSEIYRQPLSGPALHGYWQHLRPYRREIVSKAITATIESCKFLPTIADILEQIQQMPAYHQDFKALPESPVDPEETRRGLLLAGFAAIALRAGLKPGTKKWISTWADYQKASDKQREILRRKVKLSKVKLDTFKNMKAIFAGTIGRDDK